MTGHGNVWAAMTVDVERGLVYVPTSTPSNDFYGGRRLGANLFAETLVCLDAKTGQRKWHFQTVHHGLWDYDLASQPNLVTITVNGRRIDAVAQVSKQGFTYVFDRVTGTPVWPIEERPVDTTTDVPGERPYPTQPFPTKPPPFAEQGFTLDDAFDLTPELAEKARAEIRRYRTGPLFTPPSLRGTLMRPMVAGGANWGGAAFDPETQLLVVKSTDTSSLIKIGKLDREAQRQPVCEDLRRRIRRPRRRHAHVRARVAASQAAVCALDRHRPEPGRDPLARSLRQGQHLHPQPSRSQGGERAGPARHVRTAWRDRDRRRPGVHRGIG